MLYEAYQVHNDVFGPVRLMAETFRCLLNQPWPLFANAPLIRSASAAMELLSNAGLSHHRPDFGIRTVIIEGREVSVTEEVIASDPFCRLLHFRKEKVCQAPTILVVAPLSGHFPTLLRGTVRALLPDHEVFVTDWANARNVPLLRGRFGLDDYVDLVIRFIRLLGPDVHVMAVCQPSVPVLAAVSLLAAGGDPCQPASMILMGGPIDPRANPTEVNRFAEAHSLDWFERTVITTVPGRYPGVFRRVYPGFLQLAGFLSMNLDRHVSAHWAMFENLVRGDGDSAAATRAFYKEYSSVMDLPADFYLNTIKRVFHEHDLPQGSFRVRGYRVEPAAIERTALMTVEGERDDICAPGQTVSAHKLCGRIPASKKTHHLQPKVPIMGCFTAVGGRRRHTRRSGRSSGRSARPLIFRRPRPEHGSWEEQMALRGKVVITCAVTGSIHTPTMSPHLPLTPDEIARDAIAAAEAGAAILHLHARDPKDGRPTPDPDVFMQFLPRIKQATGAVINITTGGGHGMTLEERLAAPLRAEPEMCSLNMGSMNFGLYPMLGRYKEWKYEWEPRHLGMTRDFIFRNTFADIERILKDLGEGCGTRFEFECYNVGHLYNLAHFLDRGLVKAPLFVQTIFGILGGIGADPENPVHMKRIADKLFGGSYAWSILAAGRHQLPLVSMGAIMGGNVRVGLEDSLWIGRGKLAQSNADQVSAIRAIVENLSLEIASPDEARAMLALKGGDRVAF